MSKEHILIVEDDIDVANTLSVLFSMQGYGVTMVRFGADALQQCKQHLPHVIVLDIMLPDIDGYEVCRRLRSNHRTSHVPIIFLTQKDERSDKIAGLSLGADDYITKPFDVDELRLRVQGVIQRAARENLTHPVTGLPGKSLVEDHESSLAHKTGWRLLNVAIANMEPFQDKYGFVAANEVLRFTALLMSQVIDQVGTPDDFIGHIDGNRFMIVTAAQVADAVVENLTKQFRAKVKVHYDVSDRDTGELQLDDQHYKLMTLAVDVVSPETFTSNRTPPTG
jgi:DNA-binding response OmpR family regulator